MYASGLPKKEREQDAGYLGLANAVVTQAASDYRDLRSGKLEDCGKPYLGCLNSLERFFTSDWGMLLSRDMGVYILTRLKEEFDD